MWVPGSFSERRRNEKDPQAHFLHYGWSGGEQRPIWVGDSSCIHKKFLIGSISVSTFMVIYHNYMASYLLSLTNSLGNYLKNYPFSHTFISFNGLILIILKMYFLCLLIVMVLWFIAFCICITNNYICNFFFLRV